MSEKQKTFISELISDLKQQRDHLRVKIHLGGQELKEEFERLDDQLNQLNHRFDPTKAAMGETAENLWDSLRLMGGEIKDGFQRIRKSLQ
jgi:DNA anti-recombination protein RmuC